MRVEVDLGEKGKNGRDLFALKVRGTRHIFEGKSYRSIVTQMRRYCMYPVKTNRTYMKDVGHRAWMAFGVGIEIDTEKRFILSMLREGIMKEVQQGTYHIPG